MPSLMSLVASSSPLSCLSIREDDTTNEEESSLGVIYEDPDQRAEKKRLIALFEKNSTAPESANNEAVSYEKHPEEIADTSKRKKLGRRSNRSSGVKK